MYIMKLALTESPEQICRYELSEMSCCEIKWTDKCRQIENNCGMCMAHANKKLYARV